MDKREWMKQRLEERTAGKRWKLPEGETTFRVLPNVKGDKYPECFEYRMHGQVGPNKKYLRCGKDFRNKGRCWLCDVVIPSMEKSPKQSKRLAATAMKAKNCCGWMIATVNDGKWRGPFYWEAPFTVSNKILAVMHKHNVADPKRGCNLTLSRTGSGPRTTRYGDLDRDENRTAVPQGILQRLTPFTDHVYEYDEAFMKAAFYGRDPEDMAEPETEREAELTRAVRRGAPPRRREREEDQFEAEGAEETFEEADQLDGGESGDEFIEGEGGDEPFDEEAAENEMADEFSEEPQEGEEGFDEEAANEAESDLADEFTEEEFEPEPERPARKPAGSGKRAMPTRKPAPAPARRVVKRPAAPAKKPLVKRRK